MTERSKNNLERASTLRIKLVATFSILFGVTFAAISLASYGVSKLIITRDIDLQTQEVATGHAAEIDQWITRMISIVDAYSYMIGKGLPDDKKITSEILRNYSSESFFSDLYYGSVSGRFVSGTNWFPTEKYDPRVRPWFTEGVKNGKTAITGLYLDQGTQTSIVSVSSPVYFRDGSLRGVLSADVSLDTIEEKLKKIKVRGKGYSVLINETGTILFHPKRSMIGKSLYDLPNIGSPIEKIFERKQWGMHYDPYDDRFAVFTPIPSAKWIMVIVLTKDEVYGDLKFLAMKFFLIFMTALIVVILTSKFFALKLTYFMHLLECTVEIRTAELKEKIAEVEYLSLTDPLTGIANRRKIESVLSAEIDRTHRTGNPLSVIMIDIDNFKEFNDIYGHGTGDKILKKFAVTMILALRSIDIAGRIGGEEFLIICPETDMTGAFLVAEKLRVEVESMKIDSLGQITASFGCAELYPGEKLDSLISRSDQALYRAKEHGRNTVEIYI